MSDPAPERVASLVPSATETAFAVGAGGRLVARTFECDHPLEARDLPVVVRGRLDEDLSSPAIDAAVQEAAEEREPLHVLDEDRLRELAPDALLTQRVCEVCAAGTPAARRARELLQEDGRDPDVVTLEGATLDGVLDDVRQVGEALGRGDEAAELVADLADRIAAVEEAVAGAERPRVATLEWLDPPIRSGHWIPELVQRAGGEPVLSSPGDHGERIGWQDVAAAEPDVVVAAPCGYGLERAASEAREAARAREALEGVDVVAVDADACVSRPGPRIVEGVGALAAAFHPERVPDERSDRWTRVRQGG
jgi:iron complex transport system substrate-binding protein